ncbi:MAG TPA: PilZ domain-containing protein [bacterium]|nr:PilZ domain-containing protein [bacterium]
MAKEQKKNPMIDKRKSPRIELELSVSFAVSSDVPHNFFPGIMQDISTGGIFLATKQMLPIGTRLRLSFIIDNRQISGHAEVRWLRQPSPSLPAGIDPGMGLLFLDLSADDRETIEFYIRQQNKPPTH